MTNIKKDQRSKGNFDVYQKTNNHGISQRFITAAKLDNLQ